MKFLLNFHERVSHKSEPIWCIELHISALNNNL